MSTFDNVMRWIQFGLVPAMFVAGLIAYAWMVERDRLIARKIAARKMRERGWQQ